MPAALVPELDSNPAIESETPDIRASFLRFPAWTQNFWTWFTGKALPHQKPLLHHTWWTYLFTTIAGYFSGLGLSAFALLYKPHLWWLELLTGWTLTLWAARTMVLVIAHQCIHRQFSGSRSLDNFFGELVTVLTVYQDAQEFKVEHFDSHHRDSIFATAEDPPVQVLVGLGFRPGMTIGQLWRRAAWVFISPLFYWQGFFGRLRSNCVSGTWRRLGFAVWALWWLSLPVWCRNGWQVALLAFALPVIPAAQLSALLDKLGEHAWLTRREPGVGGRYYHAEATWARFCGSLVPHSSLSAVRKPAAWLRWSIAMIFYHLPARLFVVIGDLPSHDHHHRFPSTPDWTIAAYARQRDIDRGLASAVPYKEVWGIGQAIHQMFAGLSQLPPSSQENTPAAISFEPMEKSRGEC